jgi:predicted site-specific integrase-resolvase
MFVKAAKAREHYGVSNSTLRRWAAQERVRIKRTAGGHRVYHVDNSTVQEAKRRVVYCRVSSAKQKDDLARQIDYMAHQYPQHEIVKDIGSGINFKRPGLLSILGSVMRGRVQEVVVASRDRMCRFAFDLLQWIFQRNGAQILVLHDEDKTPDQDFTEDILAIMQVFSCRWNGKRRYSATRLHGVQDTGISKRVPKVCARKDRGGNQILVQQSHGDDQGPSCPI